MKIPDTVDLKVIQRYPSNGITQQHHRCDEHHLGVVSLRRADGRIDQSWYADYLPHQRFTAFHELQIAAAMVSSDQVAQFCGNCPAVVDVEPMVVTADRGHFCTAFPDDKATHLGILVRSWNNDCNRNVLLGKRALAKLKKEGAAWLVLLMDQRTQEGE